MTNNAVWELLMMSVLKNNNGYSVNPKTKVEKLSLPYFLKLRNRWPSVAIYFLLLQVNAATGTYFMLEASICYM